MDWIVTGASRGIGRALVMALVRASEEGDRVFALARDTAGLEALAREGTGHAAVIPLRADLARLAEARDVGSRLSARLSSGATLIHNAGLWPHQRELTEGLETSFVTHCLGPLALQQPLLASDRLARVLVISAGLLVKGRFDPERSPTGADFSAFRTYCTTKLAGAAAMREVARHHPDVDFAVVHPGVVRTDLGSRGGLLGALLRLVKRRWESPETCAERLMRLLRQPRWSAVPGQAPWFIEESPQAWPPQIDRDSAAVCAVVDRLLGEPGARARESIR